MYQLPKYGALGGLRVYCSPDSPHGLRLQVFQLNERIINLRADIRELQAQLSAALSKTSSVKGDVYRMICPSCIEPIDLPTSEVSEHLDDSGHKETAAKCSKCSASIRFTGTIEDCLKNRQIHKLFKQ